MPAVVDFVAARGRSGQVHWVGHSMGGSVAYGYLQRVGEEKVRSLTAVASPALVADTSAPVRRAARLFPVADFFLDRLPTGWLVELAAPWAHQPPVAAIHVVWNPDNLAPAIARATAANGTSDTSAGVLRQFVEAVERPDGALRSHDGAYDYTAGMTRITTAVLFVAGNLDQLAPPWTLARGYRAVASPDKRLEVLSRANGYAADYGHVDLAIGETAPRDLFPLVEGWLLAHD